MRMILIAKMCVCMCGQLLLSQFCYTSRLGLLFFLIFNCRGIINIHNVLKGSLELITLVRDIQTAPISDVVGEEDGGFWDILLHTLFNIKFYFMFNFISNLIPFFIYENSSNHTKISSEPGVSDAKFSLLRSETTCYHYCTCTNARVAVTVYLVKE